MKDKTKENKRASKIHNVFTCRFKRANDEIEYNLNR
jgi:hypothetical protein